MSAPLTIEDVLPDESAILELLGERAEDVLVEIAEALARQTGVGSAEVLDRLLAREALGSTAIGRGLALPHATVDVTHTHGVLGLSRAGVEFGAPDGASVHLFFALASPPEPSEHLRGLACVSRALSDPALLDRLLERPEPSSVLALLRERFASCDEPRCG